MPQRDLKYIKIYEDLRRRIETGEFPYGTTLPAERELSLQYTAQRPTLRKALQELKEYGYIETRPGSGSRVIYSPATETGESAMIAFIISGDMDRQAQLYHIQVCNYLEDYFRHKRVSVLFAKIGSNGEVPAFLTNPAQIQGIIWVSHIDPIHLENAKRAGIPCLCLASDSPLFPKINYTDFAAGFDATKYLLQQGCRRIAFINGIKGSVTRQRAAGYREALLTYGITPQEDWIVDGDWSYAAGERAAKKLLASGLPIDAVLGSNDMTAIGALKTLAAAGVRIPKDVKVIGIDNIEEGRSCVPALSTIAFSQKDIARTAYLFMQELLAGHPVPEEIHIPGHLIIRETT